MKYYISGPMTGFPNNNIPYFKQCKNELKLKFPNDKFICPHEITKNLNISNWIDYIKADVRELLNCDALVLLEGWPKSKGSRVELEIALTIEIPVFYYTGKKLISMNH